MRTKDIIDQIAGGRLNRRAFNQALAAVGLTAVTFPVVSRAARAAEEILYFTWSGYELPEFHQAYVEKYGGSPKVTFFAEEEEAFQKMRSGFRPDVSHPCTASVSRWKDAGLLRPIDHTRIEQWDRIYPSFLEVKGVRQGDEYYFMPWDWGNSSILYRTDLVDVEEESYSLFLDERYKGRMAMFDSVDAMAAVSGYLSGAKDPFNMSDAEIAAAKKVMQKMHANMRFYWADSTEIAQALASGELVAAWSWNETVHNLQSQGLPVKYMNPKEGIMTWVCGLALNSGGEGSDEAAYDFLNAFLDPRSGKYLIEEYGYGHSNRETLKLVSRERLEELGIADAEEKIANSNFYDEIPPLTREKLIAAFDEVKAGL